MGGVEREVLVETSVEKFLCRIFPVSLTVHQPFGLSQLFVGKKMGFVTKIFSLTENERRFQFFFQFPLKQPL